MDSLKKITNFDGLYGDENGKYSSEYLFLDPFLQEVKNSIGKSSHIYI
jgi:hypothetical protein